MIYVLWQLKAFRTILFSDLKQIRSLLPTASIGSVLYLRVLMILTGLLEVGTVYIITLFTTIVFSPDVARNSFIVKWIISTFPSTSGYFEDTRFIIFLASCMVVLFVVIKNIITGGSTWHTLLFSEKISMLISNEIMSRYLRKPYIWHLSSKGEETFQAMNFRGYLTTLVTNILMLQSYLIVAFLLMCVMFIAAPGLTFVVYLVMGITAYITYNLIKKSTSKAGEETTTAMAAENQATMNAIKGIREVIIYRQQSTFLKRSIQLSKSVSKPKAKTGVLPQIPSYVLEAMGFAIMAGVIFLLIKFWNADIPTVVNIVFLLMLTSWRILPTLNRCVNLLVSIRAVRPTAHVCLNTLADLITHDDTQDPVPDPNFSIKQDLALKNVYFRYSSDAPDTLINISCTIPKGSVVGFIGPSGAGKSTISTILCGLFQPLTGSFLVDNKELTPEQLAAYRLKVGYVPQSPFIFSGTIADNIAFSQWGKQYDENRIREVCEMAAMDFIKDLPLGVMSRIGENGIGVSGGQAQRVAIARALYPKPEVIIFDEATSALDHINERLIKETIEKLQKQITSIIVAHRLTTVEDCDIVFWMNKGRIIDYGDPKKIISKYINTL